jgi:hypothetical protein
MHSDVTWEPVRTKGLRVFHWPTVLRSVFYVGDRLACTELPNNSFLFPYCMVSIIPVSPLQCRIHVHRLVCVMHTLKLGYWFLCIVFVPYVLLLLFFPIVLHMNSCKCCIWICTFSWNLYWSFFFFVSCWCIFFVARRATFKLEYLKRLVIFRISGLWYENVTHFLVCSVFVVVSFCYLAISFYFRLWMMCNGNPLFWAIASMIFHSCCLVCFVVGSVNILFM